MSKKLQKCGEGLPMLAVDAREMIQVIAGPMKLGDNQKTMLARVARRLGWPFSRTENMYRGRSRIITAQEWIQLNNEAAEMAQQLKTRREAQHELDRLAGRALGRVAAAMDRKTPDAANGGDTEGSQPAAEQGRPGAAPVNRYFAG